MTDYDNFDVEGILENLDPDMKREIVKRGYQAMRQAKEDISPEEVGSAARAILLEAGVEVDSDDPEYKELVAPNLGGSASEYLRGLRQYANNKSNGERQKKLYKQYTREMDQATQNQKGAIEKTIIRQKYRNRGLEI
jgi:hypothetical protein